MVIWTIPARNDLKSIHEYIALDSPFYAKKVVQEILARATAAADLPETGRMVPETEDPDIREVFIYSYRCVYQIFSDHIAVLAVVHGQRNISIDDIKNR
jgi:plasmid stabilization system protein ParE